MTEIRGRQIRDESITGDQIGDSQITADKIAANTITNNQISPTAAIDQSKIDGLVDALADKVDASNPVVVNLQITQAPIDPTDATNKAYVDGVTAGGRYLLDKNFNLLDDNLNPQHAPFSTDILATQTVSVFNDSESFATIGHSNYSVITSTIALSTTTNNFLYQMGGSQGTNPTQIRNVSKTVLGLDGSQSTWTTTGVADLPENATVSGKGASIQTSLGYHLIYPKGMGDNLIWKTQPINVTTGQYTGWELLTPLPVNTGNPELVICDFSGTKVGYLLANRTGGSADLIVIFFDGVGDITGFLTNTIPQSLEGKLVALSNTHLFIIGTGSNSNKCFIGTINSITKNVTWASYTTNLPTGLVNFAVDLYSTQDGTNKIFVYGGSLAGTLQDNIYNANINISNLLDPFAISTSKLEAPTAGMGSSHILIGTTEFAYLTGGQRASGFIDNSTSRIQVAERTYKIVRRTVDVGAFYRVNNDESSRASKIFVIEPNLADDSTLSKPINAFYFARKDDTNTDYIMTTAVDPNLPDIVSNKENLLIRIDQVDPVTGDVKTLPLVTTPVTTTDYLDNQKLINQVFNVDTSLITFGANQITFGDKTFKVGNIRYVFETLETTFTGLANSSEAFAYWSNYDIILSTQIISQKLLLGKVSVNSSGIVSFSPATTGLNFKSNTATVLAASGTVIYNHLFNTTDLLIQVWVNNGVSIDLNSGIKITRIDSNRIQIQNITANPFTITQVLISKQG